MTAPTIPPDTAREATARQSGSRGAQSVAALRRRLGALRSRIGSDGRRSIWLVAPVAAAWCALIGLAIVTVPILILWMATPQSGLTWLESLRAAGLIWVVAHGTPIALAGTTYSLLPWGLALIPVLLLGYAGGWAARRTEVTTPREIASLVGLAATCYALLVLAAAEIASEAGAAVSPWVACVASGVLAVVALGWGATRASEVDVAAVVPGWLALCVRGGLIGAIAILGLGAVAAMISLLVHVDDAITMAQSLHAGIGGGLGLLLAGILYVPVMAVWGAAYLVGAGVVIGPAVVVSPFIPVTAPTALPPFPLLAALPQTASPLAWALPIAGVLAGVLVGLSIARGARQRTRLVRLALCVGAAVVAALVMTLAAYLSSGALGNLRLEHLGPPPLAVGLLAGLLITLGAVPSAVAMAAPERPSLLVATVEADDQPDAE